MSESIYLWLKAILLCFGLDDISTTCLSNRRVVLNHGRFFWQCLETFFFLIFMTVGNEGCYQDLVDID